MKCAKDSKLKVKVAIARAARQGFRIQIQNSKHACSARRVQDEDMVSKRSCSARRVEDSGLKFRVPSAHAAREGFRVSARAAREGFRL